MIGFFPAASAGDDVLIFRPNGGSDGAPLTTVHFLRQQMERPPGRPNLCLADYIAPQESGVADYLGFFAVTAGLGLPALVRRFEENHNDYCAILAKALADRLAEAFAERMHERVRREFWGYAPDETLDNEALIAEAYRGIRPAPGYPACPDHTEKATLFRLLEAEANAGISLTGSFAMQPAASVSGYYSHPKRATSAWAASTATRCRITPGARGWRWRPPSAGWLRCWPTTPERGFRRRRACVDAAAMT